MDIIPSTNITAATPFASNSFLNSFVTNAVWAFCILLLGLIIGKILENLLKKIFAELEINKFVEKTTNLEMKIDEIIATIASKICYFIAIVLALNQLGITAWVLNIITITVMVIVIILVLLSMKDFVPNAIAGLRLHKMNMFAQGDELTIDKTKGIVRSHTLLETTILTKSGDVIHIPNTYLFKSKFKVKRTE